MNRPVRFGLAALLLAFLWAGGAAAETAATLFLGRAFDGNIRETATLQAGALGAYFAGAALDQSVAEWRGLVRWEVEGQLAKHFGLQTHWEATGALALRWQAFWWDRYLDTSAAVGDGLSYTSRISEVEARRHKRTEKLLNYLFFEVSAALPGAERWSLVLRQHHRSGVFGTFGGVRGGSDLLLLGLRRTL